MIDDQILRHLLPLTTDDDRLGTRRRFGGALATPNASCILNFFSVPMRPANPDLNSPED